LPEELEADRRRVALLRNSLGSAWLRKRYQSPGSNKVVGRNDEEHAGISLAAQALPVPR
jgi:hypothetical protein